MMAKVLSATLLDGTIDPVASLIEAIDCLINVK
jgi:hypothetical protein